MCLNDVKNSLKKESRQKSSVTATFKVKIWNKDDNQTTVF